ncbi:MAG: hypothetical protein V3W04_13345 [Gammaproteobacteria bacterium]
MRIPARFIAFSILLLTLPGRSVSALESTRSYQSSAMTAFAVVRIFTLRQQGVSQEKTRKKILQPATADVDLVTQILPIIYKAEDQDARIMVHNLITKLAIDAKKKLGKPEQAVEVHYSGCLQKHNSRYNGSSILLYNKLKATLSDSYLPALSQAQIDDIDTYAEAIHKANTGISDAILKEFMSCYHAAR